VILSDMERYGKTDPFAIPETNLPFPSLIEYESEYGGLVLNKITLIIVGFLAMGACTPPSPPLPELTPQTVCQDTSECVWAVRLDRCCDCGNIYTLQQVETDPRLLLWPQRYDYDYAVERARLPVECQNVVCAPCMEPPFGLLCNAGNCRPPQTAAEMLGICPNVSNPSQQEWCMITAAGVALNQQGLASAVEICNQFQGTGMDGVPLQETCILSQARTVMNQHPDYPDRPDPWTSVDLCRAELTTLQGICLYEAAQVISQTEFEPALQVCESIPVDDEYNSWHRDACLDFLAYTIAQSDYDRAVSLCQYTENLEETCLEKIKSFR
jgi:hypothetical protein